MILQRLIAIFGALVLLLALSGEGPAQEKRKPVKIEGKNVLFIRVLARPFSHVYKQKDPAKGTVIENVPAFQHFYVYTRPGPEELELESGWYEVGTDNRGTVIGWMQAKDVFEWNQTMCLAYTHPEGRKPVLMFDKKKDLMKLIKSTADERIKQAELLYKSIDSQKIPSDFPIKSVEPKKAIDISEQFYLLPILNFETIEIDGREGRVLRLAAVIGAGPDAREKTDIRQSTDYLKEATEGSTVVDKETLKKLTVDVVWVMDTTVSMRPYIEKTLEVAKNVSRQITRDPEVAKGIRFGFWGYRDSVDEIPGIGYTTKNYTTELKSIDKFINTLAGVKVTTIDSVDYPEDVFSGLNDAIRNTEWTREAIKIIILVADAPSHKAGHHWNLSGQSENTLRSLANEKPVYIFALHVKDPRAKKFHELAEAQFQTLSHNKGTGDVPTYFSVASNDLEGFAKATADLTDTLNSLISKSKKGQVFGEPAVAGATMQIKALSVSGDGDFNNDASLLVDGKFPKQGTVWTGPECVWWRGTGPSFVIDLGDVYQIENFNLQVDCNDIYAVDVSVEGEQYVSLLKIESSYGETNWGMDSMSTDRNHPDFIKQLAFQPQPARFIKVYATAGDNAYSISEIQVFGKTMSGIMQDRAGGNHRGELASLEPQPENKLPTQASLGGGQMGGAAARPDLSGQTRGQPTARQLLEKMIRAALVEWIGSQTGAKAPRDIVAWATDKDLLEPAIQSMEVRLLINKRQLDSLTTVMNGVMKAGVMGQISGKDFFDSLQAVPAIAARDPNQIKNAKTVAQTGLIPEFLIGLPYQSQLMAMTNELWSSWSNDEQDEFLDELNAKIKAYQAIHDNPDGWVVLNKGDDPDEYVYPICLELLP